MISFTDGAPVPAPFFLQLATAGALDEISNVYNGVRHYIRSRGLVKHGRTQRALFFAIYQTERYGPQNGFRLCLVNEGFEIGDAPVQIGEISPGQIEDDVTAAEKPIAQGTMEFIVLGEARSPIEDPATD
ncbi:hypothetical protein MMC10_006324 [Thelotrema lepadinum]|nr:hypothetical protein [Thelotrema lepadinum]